LNFIQLRDFAYWLAHSEISISEYKLSVNSKPEKAGLSNATLCRLRRLGEEESARTPRAPAQGEPPFAIPFVTSIGNPAEEENLLLMRLLDEQYTRSPFCGIK
jgi:hypothetical protein